MCVCLSVKRAREKRERKKSYPWKQSDSRLYPEYRGLQLFLSVEKKKSRKHPKVSKLEADASRRSFSVAIVCIHLGKFDRAFFVVSFGVFTVRFTSYRLIFVYFVSVWGLSHCVAVPEPQCDGRERSLSARRSFNSLPMSLLAVFTLHFTWLGFLWRCLVCIFQKWKVN